MKVKASIVTLTFVENLLGFKEKNLSILQMKLFSFTCCNV